ncbi:MAG: lipid-A-disaccharide synthase [Verrucomicrobia bacterium]|nr:lipid-A-disaccharide synthase [Verrucomicrobiota bacterium]
MKLYLIAGEASGDARGAEVMRSLVPLAAARGVNVEFHGAGGPEMRALAPAIENWSGEAVVGLWDVLKKYPYFRGKFKAMLREMIALKPDAVILIDYPGFNLRMAKALKRLDPALRVIYYISPQVWAWNRGRIPQMARTLDLMLCIFPFEKELYEKSGLKTVFVGHPMLDSLAPKKGAQPRQELLVGLFPGSRQKEVARIFPVMLGAAEAMRASRPELRFEAAAATDALAETMRKMSGNFPLTVRLGGSHELMNQAAVGMVASGTATLEATFFEMPFVLVYRVAPLTWMIGKRLVRIPFLGISNILAGREIIPEFLQNAATPVALAGALLGMLADPQKRMEQQVNFKQVIADLGSGGASIRAAEAVLAETGNTGVL